LARRGEGGGREGGLFLEDILQMRFRGLIFGGRGWGSEF